MCMGKEGKIEREEREVGGGVYGNREMGHHMVLYRWTMVSKRAAEVWNILRCYKG